MQKVILDLLPGGVAPIVYASQYDDGRSIRFMLTEGGPDSQYSLNASDVITCNLTKPDGTETVINVANPGAGKTYVDLVNGADDYDQAGAYLGEIVLTRNARVIGSANFVLKVEEDAYGGQITTLTATGNPCTFTTDLADALVSLTADIVCGQDLHGYDHPWAGGAGKNLFDKTTTIDDNWINSSGSAVYFVGGFYSALIPVKPDTAYYLTNVIGGNDFVSSVHFDSDMNVIGAKNVSGSGIQSGSITSFNNSAYMRINSNTANKDTVMVSEGSQATPYEPYSNICPLIGHSELNLEHGVNNFLNETTFSQGSIDAATGEELDSPYRVRTDFIWLEEGNYLISSPNGFDIVADIYDENKSFKNGESYTVWASTPRKISILSGGRYARMLFRKPNNSSITPSEISGELLTKIVNTFTVAFGQTVYGGVYDKSGRMTITHGYKNIDDFNSVTDYVNAGGLHLAECSGTYINNSNAICSMLEQKTPNAGWSSSTECFVVESTRIRVYTSSTTLADFKSRFADLQIAYELATPIVIDVPSISVFAVNGVNNIVSDCLGDVSVAYIKKV